MNAVNPHSNIAMIIIMALQKICLAVNNAFYNICRRVLD